GPDPRAFSPPGPRRTSSRCSPATIKIAGSPAGEPARAIHNEPRAAGKKRRIWATERAPNSVYSGRKAAQGAGAAAAKETHFMARPKLGLTGWILGPGKYLIGLAAIAAAAWYWYASTDAAGSKLVYRLTKIESGTISNTVTASGTLKALITVDVGTQI